jgi:hypothetical protein
MSGKQLASGLVLGALAVVAIVAAVDATRSGKNATGAAAEPRAAATRESPAEALAADLETAEVEGVLYYSDPAQECRVRAARLPGLEEAAPPKLRACRFELPPQPGTAALPAGAVWRPDGGLAAACESGAVAVSTAEGTAVGRVQGCAPAWRPDGTLTVIRDGEVWSACTDAEPDCGRRLLSTEQLTAAARQVPFIPMPRRFLRSVRAVRVVWFSDTRSGVLVRVRLRGRFAGAGPQAVLAIFEGRRLLAAPSYPGAVELRLSPGRTAVGVVEAGDRVAIVGRSGGQLLAPADLPSPAAHALAWSPDERWLAVATRWSVFLLPTADIVVDRTPRVIRLPFAAGDLAWR